jgi:hypothetical protein
MMSNGLIDEIRLAIKGLQKGGERQGVYMYHLTPARINRHDILGPPYDQIMATRLS